MAKRSKPKRVLNMVAAQKERAEQFIKDFQDTGNVPKVFSGVVPVKFGELILIWQFHRNKLVGALTVRESNIPMLIAKLDKSVDSWDFLNVPDDINITEGEELND